MYGKLKTSPEELFNIIKTVSMCMKYNATNQGVFFVLVNVIRAQVKITCVIDLLARIHNEPRYCYQRKQWAITFHWTDLSVLFSVMALLWMMGIWFQRHYHRKIDCHQLWPFGCCRLWTVHDRYSCDGSFCSNLASPEQISLLSWPKHPRKLHAIGQPIRQHPHQLL